MIRIAYAVIISLIILILYLITQSDHGDWVYAVIITLVIREAYLWLSKKWSAQLNKKEKSSLTDL